MHDVERADARNRAVEAAGEPPSPQAERPIDAADVMDRCAEERVRARVEVVVQREDMDVVTPREAFDQPQQRRRDAFASGAVDAAGDDQADAHRARTK